MFLVSIVRDDNHEKVFEDNNVLLESVILMKIYKLGAIMMVCLFSQTFLAKIVLNLYS